MSPRVERCLSDQEWRLDALRAVLRLENMVKPEAVAYALMPVLFRRCMSCGKLRGSGAEGNVFDLNYLAICASYIQEGTPYKFLASNKDRLPIGRAGGYIPEGGVRPTSPEQGATFHEIKYIHDEWVRGGAKSSVQIKLGSETHNIIEIGKWFLVPDGKPPDAYIRFLLLWRTNMPNKGACKPCINKETEKLSRVIAKAFTGVPDFILKLSRPRSIDDLLRYYPDYLDGNGGSKIEDTLGIGQALNPVHKALYSIRRELALGDLVVRRWHLLLRRQRPDGAPPPDHSPGDWILDWKEGRSPTFPNDVAFNVCIPHLPRLFAAAIDIRDRRKRNTKDPILDEGFDLNSPEGLDYRAFSLLFPPHFLMIAGPEILIKKELKELAVCFGEGELPDGSQPPEGDRDPMKLMWAADSGVQFRKGTFALTDSRLPNWPAWENTLNHTWSGLAMMHIIGPQRTQKSPKQEGENSVAVTATEKNRVLAFDRFRLPAENYLFPLRRFDGQQVGFGLCCLPAGNEILEHSIKQGPEEYALFEGCKLGFAWDILVPEFHRLSERLFVSVLGLNLAVLEAIIRIVCVDGRLTLPQAFNENIRLALFGRKWNVPTRPQDTGVGLFLDIAILEAEEAASIADLVATAEVLYSFISELGHSFDKHGLGSLLRHVNELLPARKSPKLINEFPQNEPADYGTLMHSARVYNIGELMAKRMAALEGTAKLVWHRDVYSENPAPGPDITMGRLFGLLSTLPGYRMWTTTDYDTLDELEDTYWRRVRLVSLSVEWHHLTPLFRDVREGVIETALEVLIHNAFKHAARSTQKPGGYSVTYPEWEEAVRVTVTFHSLTTDGKTISAIIVWDNRPEGIDLEPLRNYVILPGNSIAPLPVDLFPPVRDLVGEEARRGQGFQVMMCCLDAQRKAKLPEVNLYLVSRDGMVNPDSLRADDSRDKNAPYLLTLLKDLKTKLNGRYEPERWPRLTGSLKREINVSSQAAFVLTQVFETPEDRPRRQPPKPRNENGVFSLAILDGDPLKEDRDIYETYFGQNPEEYYRVLSKPPNELPEIVIYHTAMNLLGSGSLDAWLRQAKVVYPQGRLPLIWVISYNSNLRSRAIAEGYVGTCHEEFQNWFKDPKNGLGILPPEKAAREKQLKVNLNALANKLFGLAAVDREKEIVELSIIACENIIENGRTNPDYLPNLIQDYSSAGAPIDPRIKWRILRIITGKQSTDYDFYQDDDLENVLKRLNEDWEKLNEVQGELKGRVS